MDTKDDNLPYVITEKKGVTIIQKHDFLSSELL